MFDKIGIAFASNGPSSDHRQYLALGGLGFLLGDGRLSYGRENIVETYYNANVWRGLFAAFDLQYIVHPGYNRDRGPGGAQLEISRGLLIHGLSTKKDVSTIYTLNPAISEGVSDSFRSSI